MKQINKQKARIFCKNYYLIGIDKDGTKRFLEEPSWDCGWYWGFGYVESFSNNRCPEKSKDIIEHTHIDSLLFRGPEHGYNEFKKLFTSTVLTDNEIWEFVDLFKSFYTLREAASIVLNGNGNYTSRAYLESVKNFDMYKCINTAAIPAIISRIITLLTPEHEDPLKVDVPEIKEE